MNIGNNRKTLVLGASPNPERYGYKAVQKLAEADIPVVAVGTRPGQIGSVTIRTDQPKETGVDTVSLYVGPAHQPDLYEYILSLKPRRIIMNPGTENPELMELANKAGIEVEVACTLVLLATKQF
ncbi:MAG: CoA-binding protein [Flavobacteriales bacterium]|nr:CoA-binding protein [Flavobacteriales bacterium]